MLSKPFKTYNQQLKILRGRNMTISNGSKAICALKRDGYYNIINGYKDIFLDRAATRAAGDDRYTTGVSFDDVYDLYNFDRELRSILLKYILRVETSLKTKLSYVFSQANEKDVFPYLDINKYNTHNPSASTKTIAKISNVIKDNMGQYMDESFAHYLNDHKELPLWVLMRKLTLGEAYHFFSVIPNGLKKSVTEDFIKEFNKEYKQSMPSKDATNHFSFYMYTIFSVLNDFRNICAHNDRLYSVVIKPKYPANIFHKGFTTDRVRVCECLQMLGLFLTKKDYGKLISEIRVNISDLKNNYVKRKSPRGLFYSNLVLQKMGLDGDYKAKTAMP